ncbi:lipocalin family protein [Leisingera caerulea]|uniref:Outer membrane lipoprotein Blc n=1 Tax=Leisingera caerulea TaxID=506591 RepID=A0ABY5WSS6_LEICA|nr:lipocalin family protein [Leisingera caerulea]UWQ48740.1 lipocalin family protein [Leisingera caerulea]UWQ57380.1 lipocalin family protein [Leisingera caerulea]
MTFRKFIPAVAASAFLIAAAAASARAEGYRNTDVPMTVQEDLDLSRYLGTWYEIARFPNRFEEGCEGVTATYSAREDARINVVNRCRREGLDGPVEAAKGVARVRAPSKLEVNFVSWLSWLPLTWGDYWVLDVAEDYSVAVVGTPSGEQGWILARSPELGAEDLAEAKAVLRRNGYDPEALEMVPQTKE